MNIKDIVQSALKASLENLDGSDGTPVAIPDAIPAEAHTPELVEESNESIDEAVHAHSVIEEHHAKLDALEHVVEEMQEVVQALESADGLGVVSQENGDAAAAAAVAEGTPDVQVVEAGATGTVDGTVVTPTDAGVVVDPAIVEPNPELSIVSLERYNANLRRLGSIYSAVGMESLPAVVPATQKPGVIAGAKARIQTMIAAMKRVWDALVAHVKAFLEHFTNAAGVTQKRAAALVAKANAAHGHTSHGISVNVYEFAGIKAVLESAGAAVKHGIASSSEALPNSTAKKAATAPWSLEEIITMAKLAESVCAEVVAAKTKIDEEAKSLDSEFDKAHASGNVSPELKAEFKAKRQALSNYGKACSVTVKVVKFALGSAEKSLRTYIMPPAKPATA